MDLSSLDSTLPPALADAERDMGDKFRGKFYTYMESIWSEGEGEAMHANIT